MVHLTSPSKPAKFSDAAGKYSRIDTSKIPSRGKSLSPASAPSGPFTMAVAASGGGGFGIRSVGSRNIASIMDDTVAAPQSPSAAIFTSHVQGIIALVGVIILLIVVKTAKITVDNATYVRGVLNMLTGLAATASAHKLSMTVAVSSLASVSTPTSPTVAVAALGLKPADAFNIVFGSDSFFQIVSFVEAICAAVASYMAGSSIVTSTTDFNKAGVALIELDISQAGTLWGICGLWIFALGLHATTAFAHKATLQTVSAASTESMREIMAVMQTESLYSEKQ